MSTQDQPSLPPIPPIPEHVLRSLGVARSAPVHQPPAAPVGNTLPLGALAGASLANVSIAPRGKLVPNERPTMSAAYRLAIVGEAPGADEDLTGKPFQGASGKFLNILLNAAGIERRACLIANICNYRPPGNQLSVWRWDSDEIQSSLDRLRSDIAEFNPNLVLLLGKYALYAACLEQRSIVDWRGSLFRSTHPSSPFVNRKCLATFHPAAVLRNYDWAPHLRFDLARARQESLTPDLTLPQREYRVGLSCDEIVRSIEAIITQADAAVLHTGEPTPLWLSSDIEGYWNRITRFSLATSPHSGFIVPLTSGEFDSHWTVDEESRIWVATSRLLAHPGIRKVFQNGLYDLFVFAYLYRIHVANVAWDTMYGHWELYAELPKNLGFQASIYTREPHWKEDRTSDDLRTKEVYCIKDSVVTEENRGVQYDLLIQQPPLWNHFQFNIRLQKALLYMELQGIKYDSARAKSMLDSTLPELWTKKHQLNVIAGRTFTGSKSDLLHIARTKLCKKKEAPYVILFAQLPGAALKAYESAARRLADMELQGLLNEPISDAALGEIESLLELELNVDSNKQMVEWLYTERKFERQYKEREDGTKALTANVNACLTLYRKTEDKNNKAVMLLILQIRALLYRVGTLETEYDPDGRMRCGYGGVGTETARLTCYASPTGSGYNLQTVTKKLRCLFTADPGYYLFQCDLAGADGWTVAAHCKRLGDPTMYDDYMYGLKPAKITAIMYEVVSEQTKNLLHKTKANMEQAMLEVSTYFNSLTREQLKSECKKVDQDGWLYFACKRVQHSSNYLAGLRTTADIILNDSFKINGEPIYVEPSVCGLIQGLYLRRYVGVPRWQTWVGGQVLSTERLVAASGRVRRFFGRLRDKDGINHDTLKAACSNEPQDNTTYATNWGMYKWWHDPENRDGTRPTGLIIRPLHQVHDAMLGQFPIECTDWAVQRIRYYLDNTLRIAGVDIKIPYEGNYGPNWGEMNVGTI